MAPKMENPKEEEEEEEEIGSNTGKRKTMSVENGNASSMKLKSKNRVEEEEEWIKIETNTTSKTITIDLGNGSEVVYHPRFLGSESSWKLFDYLNAHIPWNRPTIRVFGRSCVQPRDTCYVASPGLPKLVYSGYEPHAYSWHQFPPLEHLLKAVEDALPAGAHFNTLLLNRYTGGNDYVGWHSDDESLYGPTPQIASLSFGVERDFFLKKKPSVLLANKNSSHQPVKKRRRKQNNDPDSDHHSFTLKHGSLLLMKGNTQRDWIHSVPKRAKIDAVRINLTFRLVL